MPGPSAQDVPPAWAASVKAFMSRKGLTRADLAHLVGVHERTIARLWSDDTKVDERGRAVRVRRVSVSTMRALDMLMAIEELGRAADRALDLVEQEHGRKKAVGLLRDRLERARRLVMRPGA